MIITTKPCMECGKTSDVEMTDEEYTSYKIHSFIQTALPHWTPEQRELLITGTHPACWDAMFPEETD